VPPGLSLAAKRGLCSGEGGGSGTSGRSRGTGGNDSSSVPTTWRMYDNSVYEPRLIASGAGTEALAVNDADLWRGIRAEASHEG